MSIYGIHPLPYFNSHPPILKDHRANQHNARRRPTRSYCLKGTGWRLANWSELPRPTRHQLCHWTVHVAPVMCGTLDVTRHVLLVYIYSCMYTFCTPHAPDEAETAVVHLSNEEFERSGHDSEDRSGEPSEAIFISVTFMVECSWWPFPYALLQNKITRFTIGSTCACVMQIIPCI